MLTVTALVASGLVAASVVSGVGVAPAAAAVSAPTEVSLAADKTVFAVGEKVPLTAVPNLVGGGRDVFGHDGFGVARDREIAESYAVHYGEGVIETRVPRSIYDKHFAPYEMKYLGSPPGTELAVPPGRCHF